MYDKELKNIRNDALFLGKEHFSLDDLSHLIAFLASDDGCPWDRVQTPQTLQKHLLEEAYEAYDAIENDNDAELREELGDLLLQIVFQANLAEGFTLQDVLDGISRKMIDRHTHVFGSDQVANTAEVLDVWDANKRKEKDHLTHADALAGVARALPALTRAHKLQVKAAQAGFDWSDISGPQAKIAEELEEASDARLTLEAVRSVNADSEAPDEQARLQAEEELEMEVGDLLFAVVNWARHAGVDPEIALDRSNQKFLQRFAAVEARVNDDNKQMEELSLEALDQYWDLVKKNNQ